MTRSDLILAVSRHSEDSLVTEMHKKIENVYKILFVMETDLQRAARTRRCRTSSSVPLAQALRKALEL